MEIPTTLAWAHHIVQEWFVSKFGTPTEPQTHGWPSILAGGPLILVTTPSPSTFSSAQASPHASPPRPH